MDDSDPNERPQYGLPKSILALAQSMSRVNEQVSHLTRLSERFNSHPVASIHKINHPDLRKTLFVSEQARSWMNSISPTIFAAQKLAQRINITHALAGVPHVELGRAISGLTQMADSYGALTAQFSKSDAQDSLPDFVLPGATQELYLSTRALSTLDTETTSTPNEDVQADQYFAAGGEDGHVLLKRFAPDLSDAYAGAHYALTSNSPDKTRQMLVSLREVWNHILHRLAPDDEVLVWINHQSGSSKDFLNQGRPTRRARAFYICRALQCDQLNTFLQTDINSLLAMFDLFNCLHKKDIRLSDNGLKAIIIRSDGMLRFLLQISNH